MHYATWVGHHTLKLVSGNVKASMACACGTDVVYTPSFLPLPIIVIIAVLSIIAAVER